MNGTNFQYSSDDIDIRLEEVVVRQVIVNLVDSNVNPVIHPLQERHQRDARFIQVMSLLIVVIALIKIRAKPLGFQ